ncbi:hypothetical protein ILUMI_18747 [Ignelater luminosus]|uniref:DDE-1 domain-containing protein n=1 Tax=Ignelater luminosus TaxID=2038154 RepID=A0A8K0CLX1_IGNLU|nr:hypothetical protein ILUMI_18747 [Ignelater luminosus]
MAGETSVAVAQSESTTSATSPINCDVDPSVVKITAGEERPVLLIYDSHTTHTSTQLIRLAQQNQVTVMKLPSHTTHLLQPLDKATGPRCVQNNKEAIPTSVFKTTDLGRYKKDYPNPNCVPVKVATVPQKIDSHSTDTVPLEIAANATDTQPLEVVATPTATVPQKVVSCLTDAVPPEVAVPPGGVLLQVEQASTSIVANPAGSSQYIHRSM